MKKRFKHLIQPHIPFTPLATQDPLQSSDNPPTDKDPIQCEKLSEKTIPTISIVKL